MKTFKRKTRSRVRVAAFAGMALLVAGVAGALFKRNTERKQARLAQLAREDAEARARMDGEGGALQPGAVV